MTHSSWLPEMGSEMKNARQSRQFCVEPSHGQGSRSKYFVHEKRAYIDPFLQQA